MLGWLLRLVLLLIVLRLVWRFVAGLIDGIAGSAKARGPVGAGPGPVPLVKDPVCGTYVVRDKALTASAEGHTIWFCSERCREQWLAKGGSARS